MVGSVWVEVGRFAWTCSDRGSVTVGTPPQPQTVILDTGSSDLYFDASSAQTCQDSGSPDQACRGGTFDLSQSSTYSEVAASPAFNTSFGDGSGASGPYGSDVIGIGDVLLSPVQFGVAQQVVSTTGFSVGLMGLGYSTNEAVSSESGFYPNMPEVLKSAGEINSRLYSVFLNDARELESDDAQNIRHWTRSMLSIRADSTQVLHREPFCLAGSIDQGTRASLLLSIFSRSYTKARAWG